MSDLKALLSDLRDRHLWPVVVVLLAAIVAVPLLLSKSPAPASQSPQLGLQAAVTQSGPQVTLGSAYSQSKLPGNARDPFTQQTLSSGSTGSTGSTGSVGTTGSSATTPPSTGSRTPSTTVGCVISGGCSTGSHTSPTTTKPHTTTNPSGLSGTQAYHVAVSITDSSGGVNTIDPLGRLDQLPSAQQPMLLELGVLQGGKQVLFAVQPGVTVSGPGTCTPGPLDCEVIALSPDQLETASTPPASDGSTTSFQFTVTDITTDTHSSAAAAKNARAQVSATGAALLKKWSADGTLDALSLFQFDPTIDALVDQRDISVGGN